MKDTPTLIELLILVTIRDVFQSLGRTTNAWKILNQIRQIAI